MELQEFSRRWGYFLRTTAWALLMLLFSILVVIGIDEWILSLTDNQIHDYVSALVGGFVAAWLVSLIFYRLDSPRIHAHWKLEERLAIKMRILDAISELDRVILRSVSQRNVNELVIGFKWALGFVEVVDGLYGKLDVIPKNGRQVVKEILGSFSKVTQPDLGDLRCLRGKLRELAGTLEFK